MGGSVTISFEPKIDQLNQIKEWLLIGAKEKRHAGLYSNWDNVEDSFGRNEIAIILLSEIPLVF